MAIWISSNLYDRPCLAAAGPPSGRCRLAVPEAPDRPGGARRAKMEVRALWHLTRLGALLHHSKESRATTPASYERLRA